MLLDIYQTLDAYYGDLHWWPAASCFEMMAGAILTQNTSWTQVERALAQLEGHLSAEGILALPLEELETRIRPAGFFRQKAQYLRTLAQWFLSYGGDLEAIRKRPLEELRPELLALRGVGRETADSILLYAFDFPSFVVDAYTRRLFDRLPVDAGSSYEAIKGYCESQLPQDLSLYQQFHALIVQNAKDHCRKKPLCAGCPLAGACAVGRAKAAEARSEQTFFL